MIFSDALTLDAPRRTPDGYLVTRAKAARTRDRLETKGFSAADIDRVRMPLGADIGARTPAEIGVSIAAELITFRARLAERPRARPQAEAEPTVLVAKTAPDPEGASAARAAEEVPS